MRAIFFIGSLLAMGYVAYLQMSAVKEHDLDKVENRVTETKQEVDKILSDYEEQLNKNME